VAAIADKRRNPANTGQAALEVGSKNRSFENQKCER